MKEDDDPLFMEIGWLVSEIEGRKALYFMLQGSFDHLQGDYIRGLWEDMLLSCKGSAGKSLASHLLRDGSRLKKRHVWARNPRGLFCYRIAHKPDFRLWLRSMLVWGYLGLLWALICLGLLNGDAGPKAMVPTMPPFFRLGSAVFPN